MTAEKRISTNIVDYLRRLPRAHARKVHGDPYVTKGEPDVDAVIAGRAVKLEVKRPETRGRVTPHQKRALAAWAAAGAVTGVVCSVDETRALLEEHGLV